ncbi:MAG: ABC transporter substrate-binding protein/permease [Chlorobiaceae bacterium]|nr:ABC transporter substrate-binding protein/permease [Chlorobiaceae bacterium]NTW09801.1 ABC transporter substrate-binding protein/permease [Chlorobiaceae bacterium]
MKKTMPVISAIFMIAIILASCGGQDRGANGAATASSRTFDELKKKRIAVLVGSTHEQYAMNHFQEATVLQYKSPADLVLAVKTGKADAALYNSGEIFELIHHEPEFCIVGKPLYSALDGMGFQKGHDELRIMFNRFLGEIRRNGVYDDMMRRWVAESSDSMPVIPESRNNAEPLNVGIVFDVGLPFAEYKDNQVIGFNIELLKRFGLFIDRKINLENLEFGSLFAALETSKIDMIGAVVAITEERSKKVDFSDPYFRQDAYMFSLRNTIYPGEMQLATGAGNQAASFFSGIAESCKSNIIQEGRWKLIAGGLWVTIMISALSILSGTLFGGVVCFLRMSKNRAFRAVAKIYISVMRGTPVLVVLMLIFYVVFASVNIDPVIVAVIAFGMNFGAYASEIYRAGIETIDKGQSEAGLAMGFSRLETFRYIILPQTVLRILPVYKGEFISLVKMTSIVGYIAVQDLTKASDIIRSRTFDAFFPIILVAVLYYLISWSLLLFLGSIEKRADPKSKRVRLVIEQQ